ncbi:phosphopantetheine-binding protein [Parafrankia sp. FMc6]|uniref:phosphopantetheine-binding protein n=1 Tax=Parafrankia soli TaxID=2599596 RepID=UPI0034D47344
MLSLHEFTAVVARCAGLESSQVAPEARLGADLGLDSFALLELCAVVSDLGVDLSEREWLSIGTVGELFERYEVEVHGGRDIVAEVPPCAPISRADLSAPPGSPRGSAGPVPEQAGQPLLPLVLGGRQGGRGVADQTAPVPPERAGKYFRLVPVLPNMVPFLYELAVSPDVGFRWRYRGSVPNYVQFEQELWNGMLAQFVVESIESGEPVGNVICYNPDFALGVAYVGAAMLGRYAGSGIAVEPVRLFIRYLFAVWPFRKLYFELPEFNYRQFTSATGERLRVEGRLVDHDYYGGRYWDRLILATYRDDHVGQLEGR